MDPTVAAKALVDVHREIQIQCGDKPTTIDVTTCPLGGIKGFDSLLVATAIRMLAAAVGIKLPKDTKIENLYVSKTGKRKLTIAETAERFCHEFARQEVKKT